MYTSWCIARIATAHTYVFSCHLSTRVCGPACRPVQELQNLFAVWLRTTRANHVAVGGRSSRCLGVSVFARLFILKAPRSYINFRQSTICLRSPIIVADAMRCDALIVVADSAARARSHSRSRSLAGSPAVDRCHLMRADAAAAI